MSIPSFSLEGQVAVVTGGRRGIGRCIALTFAEVGADIAVCDIVVEGGEMGAMVEEVKKLGRRSVAVQADITRKTDVDNLVRRVEDELGGIDILVNNAAIEIRAPLLDLCEDDWDRVINTDLKGYYLCCQAVGKRMVERKRGNIINIASTAAMKTSEKMGAYCSAKMGVVMLTRVLALELASYNIRVNAIAPSMVKTEFSRHLWSDLEAFKQIEARQLLGRLAEPTDIANAALFLVSDLSSYITGTTIVVDGGGLA